MPYTIRPAEKGTMAIIGGKLVDVDLLLLPVRAAKALPRGARIVKKRRKRSAAAIRKGLATRAANRAAKVAQLAASQQRPATAPTAATGGQAATA